MLLRTSWIPIIGTMFLFGLIYISMSLYPIPDNDIDTNKVHYDIHENDSVRIVQHKERISLINDLWEVSTELWCTYKDKLYLEEREYSFVKLNKVDSVMTVQFNKIHPIYLKLKTKVENRIL